MENKFSTGEIAMSFLTAFILGGCSSLGVGMLFSGGKFNTQGLVGCALAGLLAGAKDYRSLKRLPAVTNGSGNTEQITK